MPRPQYRQHEDLFTLPRPLANRYPLATALCRLLDRPWSLSANRTLGLLDRARTRGEGTITGDAIPSIFAPPTVAPNVVRVAPIDDEEPTLIQWGRR